MRRHAASPLRLWRVAPVLCQGQLRSNTRGRTQSNSTEHTQSENSSGLRSNSNTASAGDEPTQRHRRTSNSYGNNQRYPQRGSNDKGRTRDVYKSDGWNVSYRNASTHEQSGETPKVSNLAVEALHLFMPQTNSHPKQPSQMARKDSPVVSLTVNVATSPPTGQDSGSSSPLNPDLGHKVALNAQTETTIKDFEHRIVHRTNQRQHNPPKKREYVGKKDGDGYKVKDFFRTTGNGWNVEYRNNPAPFGSSSKDSSNGPVDMWGAPIVKSSMDERQAWVDSVTDVKTRKMPPSNSSTQEVYQHEHDAYLEHDSTRALGSHATSVAPLPSAASSLPHRLQAASAKYATEPVHQQSNASIPIDTNALHAAAEPTRSRRSPLLPDIHTMPLRNPPSIASWATMPLDKLMAAFSKEKALRVAQYTVSNASASTSNHTQAPAPGSTTKSWLMGHSKGVVGGDRTPISSTMPSHIPPSAVVDALVAAGQWERAVALLKECIAETGTIDDTAATGERQGRSSAVVSKYVSIDKPFPSSDVSSQASSPLFSPLRSPTDKVSIRFGQTQASHSNTNAIDTTKVPIQHGRILGGSLPLFPSSLSADSRPSGTKANSDATSYVGALINLYAAQGMWREALSYIGSDMVALESNTTALIIAAIVGVQREVGRWVGLAESIYFGYLLPMLLKISYSNGTTIAGPLPQGTGLTLDRCRELLYAANADHQAAEQTSRKERATLALNVWNTFAKRTGQSTMPMIIDLIEGLLIGDGDIETSRSFLLPLFFGSLGYSIPVPPSAERYEDLGSIPLDGVRYSVLRGICSIMEVEQELSTQEQGAISSRLLDLCDSCAEVWAAFVPSINRDRTEREHLRSRPMKRKANPPKMPVGNVPAPAGSFLNPPSASPLLSPPTTADDTAPGDDAPLAISLSNALSSHGNEVALNVLLDQGNWEAAFEMLPDVISARSGAEAEGRHLSSLPAPLRPIASRLALANHVLSKALSGAGVGKYPIEALDGLIGFIEREGLLEVAAEGCIRVSNDEGGEKTVQVFSEGQRQSLVKSLTRIMQSLASLPSDDARLSAVELFTAMGAANDRYSVSQAIYVIGLLGKEGISGTPNEVEALAGTNEVAVPDANLLWEALDINADAPLDGLKVAGNGSTKVDKDHADANARRAALLHTYACYKAMCAQPTDFVSADGGLPFVVRDAGTLNDSQSLQKLFVALSYQTKPNTTVPISGARPAEASSGTSSAVPSSIDILTAAFPAQQTTTFTPLAKALFPRLEGPHAKVPNQRLQQDTVNATAHSLRLMAWEKEWEVGLAVCSGLRRVGELAAVGPVLGQKLPFIPKEGQALAEDLLHNNN